MKTNGNPGVDAYIQAAAAFARPILRHLRKLVHRACPEVKEEVKWSMPFFVHGGILCYMAAFKQHCGFGFWGPAMRSWLKKEGVKESDAMGSFGRITSPANLPDDKKMLRYIRQAVKLAEAAKPARPQTPKAKLKTRRVKKKA